MAATDNDNDTEQNIPMDPAIHHDFCSENEEVNSDDLLSQIYCYLIKLIRRYTGPSVSDEFSKLVNDKFQTEYTVEKRKEILQKYKVPINCKKLFVA